jgi:hypothetical protein
MHVKKSVGKPDAGNRHVRFDERGDGNGLTAYMASAPRLSSTLPKSCTEISDIEKYLFADPPSIPRYGQNTETAGPIG